GSALEPRRRVCETRVIHRREVRRGQVHQDPQRPDRSDDADVQFAGPVGEQGRSGAGPEAQGGRRKEGRKEEGSRESPEKGPTTRPAKSTYEWHARVATE